MDARWDDQLKQTIASLNYLQPMVGRPVAYTYEPPPGTPWRTGTIVPQSAAIRDARPVAQHLSLDEHGFALVRSQTLVRDFYDAGEVKSVYYPEVENALRDVTGAHRVIAFDHNVRNAQRAANGEPRAEGAGQAGPQRFHCRFRTRRARDELLARGENVAEALKGRFAIVNLWRPIRGPLVTDPIAVCDARTIELEDLVPSDLVYRDRVGETYSVTHNRNHRWFYFSEMSRDEALLIKVFDSAEDGPARFSAHTAFDNPEAPHDAAPRESIEVRALVLWS